MWVTLAVCALTAALVPAPAAAQAASTRTASLLDFVTFDRIDYIRFNDEPGRALTRDDLGDEFAQVVCSIGEDNRTCSYGLDGGAAFLPAGTRLYAVRGYATEFRLAALSRGHLYLYQAWRNPRARTGGALFDIAGRVRAIDVWRGEPTAESSPARITAAADVDALVGMIARGRTRPPAPHPAGEPRYWLTFWLADGTTLGRAYFPESGELMGGVSLGDEFRAVLDRYLPS
ncbi:MAG TPA: hypothetical protein VFE48_22565 [Methylomirabilota bacterium]|nr:hypothetical protein [Methylomirabilota bacterium]